MTQQHKRMPAEERKKQLMEIALRLFAEKGFEETKTREIAMQAGISEAAMFKLFKNKDEIIRDSLEYKFGCAGRRHKQAFLASLDTDESSSGELLENLAYHAIDLIENNMDLVRVALHSAMKHPEETRKFIKTNIKEDERIFQSLAENAMQRGIMKQFDSHIVGPLFPIMTLGLVLAHYIHKGRKTTKKERENLVRNIVEIYLHGILK